MNPEDRERDELDQLASSLPPVEPPKELWGRIETDLREIQRRNASMPDNPAFIERLTALLRRPALRIATVVLLLLGGTGMGWYLIQDYGRRHEISTTEPSNPDDMLTQAREDIEQAMFFYERAIEKLSIAAQEREDELDPEFVALQKAKISMLRESITECKTTMRDNGLHPRVQHYLLAAYSDLQSTLQEMLEQTQ